ncbi:unnamed protein product [Victoria cruziana]
MEVLRCPELPSKASTSKVSTLRYERSRSAPQSRTGEDFEEFECRHSNLHSRHMKLDLEQIKYDINVRKRQSINAELQTTLKEEILQLETRLKDQLLVRQALENALGYRRASRYTTNGKSMPKPTEELIKEIAILELEVVYLEQYLLSLYRQAFNQQVPSSNSTATDESSNYSQEGFQHQVPGLENMPKRVTAYSHSLPSRAMLIPQNSFLDHITYSDNLATIDKQADPGVQRCHSSLSQSSVCSDRNSPPLENMGLPFRGCHSQPLYSTELQNSNSGIISLADHLGTCIADHVPETPNRLSEDMIRCMGSIYCKLAEPPLPHLGASSPTSSLSSMSTFSPQDPCDMWSPHGKHENTCDARLENPFQIDGAVEPDGPYSTMVEVPSICTDGSRLRSVESMLQTYGTLVRRLEKVDPRKMKNEERLAFWINIHNALVMHAYITCGISQNNVKRAYLLFKTAYNVGGQTINADTIQCSVLKCRMPRPSQWLRTLLSPKSKFKFGDDRQGYAIHYSEPLLNFALCSGCYSDPAVRMYTPKRVFQELEAAKQEYIQASIGIRNEEKILLPRILENFARDSCLSTEGLLAVIQNCLPEIQRTIVRKCLQSKSRKCVEWIPHNFSQRYLLAKELTKA